MTRKEMIERQNEMRVLLATKQMRAETLARLLKCSPGAVNGMSATMYDVYEDDNHMWGLVGVDYDRK